jgi:hypothetical protein
MKKMKDCEYGTCNRFKTLNIEMPSPSNIPPEIIVHTLKETGWDQIPSWFYYKIGWLYFHWTNQIIICYSFKTLCDKLVTCHWSKCHLETIQREIVGMISLTTSWSLC